MATTTLEADDRLQLGGYQLVARLGSGGMGVVYLARTAAGLPVAIKVIRPEFLDDDEFRRRFEREVDAAVRVSCPWTARVLDVDTEATTPYLVTEYVPGDTLLQRVERDGPLEGLEALAVGAGLAAGLAAVHAAGVVHRDLTPANVILTPNGPKLIDLGVASIEDSTRITRTGMSFGTPSWMAPEQAQGQPVSASTDVFAWGGVMTFATTGRAPFGTGRAEAVLYRIVHQEPNLDGVAEGLADTLSASLIKDPQGRPSAAQLAGALAGAVDVDVHAVTLAVSSLIATSPLPASPRRIPRSDQMAEGVTSPKIDRRSLHRWSLTAAAMLLIVALAGSAWLGAPSIRRLLRADPTAADPSPNVTQAPTPSPPSPSPSESPTSSPSPSAHTKDRASTPAPVAVSTPKTPSTRGAGRWASLRFNPQQDDCTGAPKRPEIDREWQVSAGAFRGGIEVWPADRMSLGLRNKFGWMEESQLNIPIVVAVTNPQGRRDVMNTFLQMDQWAEVTYPSDSYDMWSGVHTVVWTDSDGRFLACHGFVVEELPGE